MTADNLLLGNRLRKLCESWHVTIGVDSGRGREETVEGGTYVHVVVLRAIDGRPGSHVFRKPTLDGAIEAASRVAIDARMGAA